MPHAKRLKCFRAGMGPSLVFLFSCFSGLFSLCPPHTHPPSISHSTLQRVSQSFCRGGKASGAACSSGEPSAAPRACGHLDQAPGILASLLETMLLLIILPPSVASDLGTTVMILPLVVFTYVAAPGAPVTRVPMEGVTVGRVYVVCVPGFREKGVQRLRTKGNIHTFSAKLHALCVTVAPTSPNLNLRADHFLSGTKKTFGTSSAMNFQSGFPCI